MSAKYEMYEIWCSKTVVVDDKPETDDYHFKVRGTSHTQHIAGKTHINGLAKSAENKIVAYKDAGYIVTTEVGGRSAVVDN
jgi:hypothetical protein